MSQINPGGTSGGGVTYPGGATVTPSTTLSQGGATPIPIGQHYTLVNQAMVNTEVAFVLPTSVPIGDVYVIDNGVARGLNGLIRVYPPAGGSYVVDGSTANTSISIWAYGIVEFLSLGNNSWRIASYNEGTYGNTYGGFNNYQPTTFYQGIIFNSGVQYLTSYNLTATGASQGTAYAMNSTVFYDFTTVAAGTGALLPHAGYAINNVQVGNYGANNLFVYPYVGDSINALGVNNPYTVTAGHVGYFSSHYNGSIYIWSAFTN